MSKKRQDWLMQYVNQNGDVSIVDEPFVNSYIEAFKNEIKVGYQPIGCNTVPDLSKQLKALYDKGLLERFTWSCGQKLVGFPTWWYIYALLKVRG